MWTLTGERVSVNDDLDTATVLLSGITSESEGDAFEVERNGRVIARVQEYSGTIALGAELTMHGPLWMITPLGDALRARWAKSRGQAIFGFATRDDAVGYGLRHFA